MWWAGAKGTVVMYHESRIAGAGTALDCQGMMDRAGVRCLALRSVSEMLVRFLALHRVFSAFPSMRPGFCCSRLLVFTGSRRGKVQLRGLHWTVCHHGSITAPVASNPLSAPAASEPRFWVAHPTTNAMGKVPEMQPPPPPDGLLFLAMPVMHGVFIRH